MKRFLILLSLLFCNMVYADTINLHWYVGDNLYQTTTCEIGGGVSLPTEPTKHGYDFIGWSEIFNCGTFANWAAIPNSASGYLNDSNGSHIPQENDYIIVNDASDVPEYGENIEIQVFSYSANSWYYCRTYIDGVNYGCGGNIYNNNIQIKRGVFQSRYGEIWYSNLRDVYCKSSIYKTGNEFIRITEDPTNNGTYYAKFINGYPYSGKWLLRYHGNWSDWGRGGWVAEKSLD